MACWLVVKSIDLITDHVIELGTFLKTVAPVTAQSEEPSFSSYTSDDVEIMISPSALVPMSGLGGLILHFAVDDLDARVARLAGAGMEPVWGPQTTDWGTTSVLYAGPAGVVVDLFTQTNS